jgi:hypothetical protein
MVVLLYITAVFGIVGMFLVLLPCGTVNAAAGCTTAFLPIPSGMTNALSTGVGMVKWSLYVAGDGIGDALVVCIVFFLGLTALVVFWKAFRNFLITLPILRRFL